MCCWEADNSWVVVGCSVIMDMGLWGVVRLCCVLCCVLQVPDELVAGFFRPRAASDVMDFQALLQPQQQQQQPTPHHSRL